LSAVTAIFLVILRKTKAKQSLGKRVILPEAPCPGKLNRYGKGVATPSAVVHDATGIC
jgi:hypothetical protein